MTGKDITARARSASRAEIRDRLKLARTPLEDFAARAKAAALKRQQAGETMAVPLALQTALAADVREYREPRPEGRITPPEEKTPERVRRRGKTTPMGVLMRGMVQPGFTPKEGSGFAYAAGSNYMDRQVPPERERGEE